MIEDQHGVDIHEGGIGKIQWVSAGERKALEIPSRLVCQVAQGASLEASAGGNWRSVPFHDCLDNLERVIAGSATTGISNTPVLEADDIAGNANEREAPHLLAAFNAFQEKARARFPNF